MLISHWPFDTVGTFTLRGELNYNSRFYFTPFNSEASDQEGYTIFNARLKYTAPDEQWYVAVYGRNLAV